MNVYDTIPADAVEVNDLVLIQQDQLEVTKVVDEGDSILITGYSFVSGDSETYILPADHLVELWTE